jgi:LuxR family maltose regulon positive regulatory protein
MVTRRRLLDRLQEDPAKTLILRAPSGYGKTVLLEQLAASDRRGSHTVLLSDCENDPAVLVRSIAEALHESEPVSAEVFDSLRAPQPEIENVVVPRMFAELESREPFLLILDELERLESPHSQAVVAALVRGMPAGSQLAIASRVEPPLRLGRLRASGRLTELRREDLTMTKGECAALLATTGLELSPRQLDMVVRRVEGWPAAVYLAGLALSESSDLDRALARFAGDDRIVADYLQEEFLQPASGRQLRFLRRASALERMSGELCDAMLEREGSASTLLDLARSNMLLIPLDRTNTWFRFHPLLREMLRSDLHRSEPQVEREMHLRASEWWRAQGDWDQAIGHAVEAAAPDRAGELLWSAVPTYLSRGRLATVAAWLQRLGEPAVRASPGLSLSEAGTQLTLGRGPEAEHWVAVAKDGLAAGSEPASRTSLQAGVRIVEATLARGGIAAMRASIDAIEPLFGEDDPWRTLCCLIDGVGMHLQGDLESARERLLEGARRGSVGAPNVQCLCLAQLALLHAERGDWQAAEREALRARGQVDRYGLGEYPMIALAFATSAHVRARRGATDAAGADLLAGRRRLGELDDFVAWFEIETMLTLARASVRLGDRDAARGLLDEASGKLAEAPDGPALWRWRDELESTLRGGAEPPGEQLTAAELRIAQFLPSHLSFPQIAAAVHLSPNTVKTHVRSIYRKLGASSRQEAIVRARGVGLLEDDPVPIGRVS